MAATLDANATADVTGDGVTSITSSNLTVGVGSNRALVVQLAFSLKTLSALAVTWDNGGTNQACAVIPNAAANGAGAVARAEMWGLVAPTSGAKQLRAAWTGSSDVVVNGVAWTGVDQTGGATSFPHGTSAIGTSNAPTVTVTSATGNATMATTAMDVSTYSAESQTQTFRDNTPATISAAGSRAAGAATVAHGFTSLSGASKWVVVGTDILAAGAGARFILCR